MTYRYETCFSIPLSELSIPCLEKYNSIQKRQTHKAGKEKPKTGLPDTRRYAATDEAAVPQKHKVKTYHILQLHLAPRFYRLKLS